MKYFSKERFCNFNLHYDSFRDLKFFFDKMAEFGIQHCELIGGHQSLYFDHEYIEDLTNVKKYAKDSGCEVSVITAQNCRFPYQYAAKEPELKEMTYNFFANGIRIAGELGAHVYQCNTGWGYWNENIEEAQKRSADMLRRLSEFAAQYDVKLACESLRPQESLIGCKLDQVKKVYDMIDHPNFKILLDTTAMGVAGETIQDWFDVFGENIIHSHFIDTTPYFHLAWGEGKRNLPADLKTFHDNGYKGLFSAELTLGSYYLDPVAADKKNIAALWEHMY